VPNADIAIATGLSLSILFVGTNFGGMLAGWTGWGGWIVSGAIVWMFFPPLVALVAAQPVIFAMDGLLASRGKIVWSEVRRILPWAAPAVPVGALVALWLPEQALLLFAGIVLLAATFPALWRIPHFPRPLAGLLGGFWTTAGGWNSPPLALAVSSLSPDERRGTLGFVFLVLSLLALPSLLLAGIDKQTLGQGLVLGAMLAPCALLGTALGLWSQVGDGWLFRIGQGLSLFGALVLIVRALG
jgi:uncharacterized membrane protein YfcA